MIPAAMTIFPLLRAATLSELSKTKVVHGTDVMNQCAVLMPISQFAANGGNGSIREQIDVIHRRKSRGLKRRIEVPSAFKRINPPPVFTPLYAVKTPPQRIFPLLNSLFLMTSTGSVKAGAGIEPGIHITVRGQSNDVSNWNTLVGTE